MSAVELKFEGSFESSNYLKDFECCNCDKFITDNDISESNYRLLVSDYANEVKKRKFSFTKIREKFNLLWSKFLVKKCRTLGLSL